MPPEGELVLLGGLELLTGVVDGQRVFLGSALGSDFYPASDWFSGGLEKVLQPFWEVLSPVSCAGKWDESVRKYGQASPIHVPSFSVSGYRHRVCVSAWHSCSLIYLPWFCFVLCLWDG